MGIDPTEDLPEPEDDELLSWVYNHVHAVYAEHWSRLYDCCPDNAISIAVLLTYRALQIALEDRLTTTDDEEDTDDGLPS